jgi:hypothetical protein
MRSYRRGKAKILFWASGPLTRDAMNAGNKFHFRPIQTDAWIIETRTGRQIARPDQDDLASSRRFDAGNAR